MKYKERNPTSNIVLPEFCSVINICINNTLKIILKFYIINQKISSSLRRSKSKHNIGKIPQCFSDVNITDQDSLTSYNKPFLIYDNGAHKKTDCLYLRQKRF